MDGYESQIKNKIQDLQIKNTPKVQTNGSRDTVVEMRFLALSWLDDFEKGLFDGKTISKLLNHREYD
jgi:hypothetical protein